MLLWTMSLAFAGKWEGVPADVTAAKVLPVTKEQVTALLGDWRGWQAVMPETCAGEWEIQSSSAGVGAKAKALYTFGPVRRRLVGNFTKVESGLVVETETEGKKGWFTQVTFADAPGGVEVKFNTPITPPKWPFTAVYYNKAKPAWEACYAGALDRIPGAVR